MALAPLRILTAAELRRLVPMAVAIDVVSRAFVELSRGRVEAPLRTHLEGGGGTALYMPARLPELGALGVKAVSVYPDNPSRGLPTITAAVLIQDAATGAPVGLIEGASLTALRTGAASGLATRLLSRPDAAICALFGTGTQARTQLEALCAVREVTQVRVVGRDAGRTEAFVSWARVQPWLRGATMLAATDPALAVRGADLIVTATTSVTPVVPSMAVGLGAHLNVIGAFTPRAREVEGELMARATVVVDSRDAALAEAGDLLLAIAEGHFHAEGIHAEIGEVAAGARPGRRHRDEVTLFKSVGTAALDVAVGAEALRRAVTAGVGITASLA